MKEQLVNRVAKALDLHYQIIGVKFIYFRQDYEALDAPQLDKVISICAMAKRAMDGQVFKAKANNVGCIYGGYAVGLLQPDADVLSGHGIVDCDLYESAALNRQVIEGMKFLRHQAYGLQMGPLAQLPDADVVVMLGTAYQLMRIMQGYAYHHGIPHNLCSIGNQAMCSDLIAKPFTNNDINISFMCKGARLFTQCSDGELAAAVPVQMFDSLVDGILKTVNPVLEKNQKEELLSRLDSADELGITIDSSWTYSTRLRQYMKRVEQMRQEDAAQE